MGVLRVTSTDALIINKTEAPPGNHLVLSSATGLMPGDEARVIAAMTADNRAVFAQLTFRRNYCLLSLFAKEHHTNQPLCDEQRLIGVTLGSWVDLAICCGDGKVSAMARNQAGTIVRCRGDSAIDGTRWGLGTGRVFREVQFGRIQCRQHYPFTIRKEDKAGCPHCGQTCPCCEGQDRAILSPVRLMDEDIKARMDRLYAALGRVIERDLNALPPTITTKPGVVAIHQDFSGGESEAELSDALHSSIASVASFHDHLQEWGHRNNVSKETVHTYFKSSPDFCIVRDLWNSDKHGGELHKDGWSKQAPTIVSVRRVLEMSGPSTMIVDQRGQAVVSGDGDVRAVVTGRVVDKQGKSLGDAHDYLERAVKLCETALNHFGAS